MKKKIFYSTLFVLLSFSCIKTDNCLGDVWIPCPNFPGINATVNAITLVKVGGTSYIYIGGMNTDGGIFRSTDSGISWSICNNGIQGYDVFDIYANNQYIWLACGNGGIFQSTNYGNNWIPKNSGIPANYVFEIDYNPFDRYCSVVYNNGFYMSTNNGTNWYSSNSGLTSLLVRSIEIYNTNLYIGTLGNGIFKSSNGGNNWYSSSNGLGTGNVHDIKAVGNSIFAAVFNSGAYRSTDEGESWFILALQEANTYQFGIRPNWKDVDTVIQLFLGTQSGVYFSLNEGDIWYQKNEGFTSIPIVLSICVIGDYVYAGTMGQGLWRRPLSDFTSVKKTSTNIADKFNLEQNYPNPFNPKTTIRMDIPKSSNVKLIVYDILGKEVATLVNEKLQPSTYEVTWDGSQYPSGAYFYKLETEGFSETKRMVLVK